MNWILFFIFFNRLIHLAFRCLVLISLTETLDSWIKFQDSTDFKQKAKRRRWIEMKESDLVQKNKSRLAKYNKNKSLIYLIHQVALCIVSFTILFYVCPYLINFTLSLNYFKLLINHLNYHNNPSTKLKIGC